MACPITKTLRVLFTAPQSAPSSGYRIRWRVVGTSTYTTAIGPFLSSPATINNVPACEDIEGTVESSCGGVFSTVVTFTATKEQSIVCGGNLSDSILSPTFVTYPQKLIDLQGSADFITLNYDASTTPNRFSVYNSNNGLIVSSGWVGTAAYAGPWGASLSTSSSGTLTFTKSTAGGDQRWYYLTVEHAGNANTTDAWTASVACAAPPAPTYAVVPSVTSVNEGGTVTFTVTTTSVANGTTLYYTTAGSATAGDFSDNATSGSVVINNNTGTITRTITSDATTEGAENFTLSLRTVSTAGTVVATATTVTINDTSTTPSVSPTYSIVPNVTSVNEGGSVTFTVTTVNVANGTILYWVASGSGGLIGGDFTGGALSGQVTINNNTGSIVRSIVNDAIVEGAETFSLALKTGSTSGPTVATSATVTINDTSTAPISYNVGLVVNMANAGTVNCLGTQYPTENQYVTATLYDSNGTPVSAPSNVVVTFNQLFTPCTGGGATTQTGSVTILAGQSSANSQTWQSATTVDCGQYGCQVESTQYDCALSNSANYPWAAGTFSCNNNNNL